MNKLMNFKNEDFGNVRTVMINDIPYFVGKDVAEILGYSNSRDALSKRVDDEDKRDGVAICDSIGREQTPVLINESGLYSLILSSKLPNAKKFKRWVTSEVLPQIRKTGSYQSAPQSYPEALRRLAQEVEQRELIEKQRDEAIKTKAWISDKKTATAMNTTSQKSKEVKKLQIALDLEMSYATVKKVECTTGRKYNWRNLKKYCEDAGLGWNKVFDANYGSVNSYPAEAWKNVYGVDLQGGESEKCE